MTTLTYTRSDDHAKMSFAKAIEAALPGKHFVVRVADDTKVVFDDTLTAGETTTVNDAVAAFVPLDDAKQAKRDAIDSRTRELIAGGFAHNGRVFSLSETAQRNLKVMKDDRDSLTYPFNMSTADNSEVYGIADAAEVLTMYGVALTTLITHYQGGNALKAQVNAAVDVAGVDAVVDNR